MEMLSEFSDLIFSCGGFQKIFWDGKTRFLGGGRGKTVYLNKFTCTLYENPKILEGKFSSVTPPLRNPAYEYSFRKGEYNLAK